MREIATKNRSVPECEGVTSGAVRLQSENKAHPRNAGTHAGMEAKGAGLITT